MKIMEWLSVRDEIHVIRTRIMCGQKCYLLGKVIYQGTLLLHRKQSFQKPIIKARKMSLTP